METLNFNLFFSNSFSVGCFKGAKETFCHAVPLQFTNNLQRASHSGFSAEKNCHIFLSGKTDVSLCIPPGQTLAVFCWSVFPIFDKNSPCPGDLTFLVINTVSTPVFDEGKIRVALADFFSVTPPFLGFFPVTSHFFDVIFPPSFLHLDFSLCFCKKIICFGKLFTLLITEIDKLISKFPTINDTYIFLLFLEQCGYITCNGRYLPNSNHNIFAVEDLYKTIREAVAPEPSLELARNMLLTLLQDHPRSVQQILHELDTFCEEDVERLAVEGAAMEEEKGPGR
jgi:hypothetical protein